MREHIIVSSCLFGSVYLFTKSLYLLNRTLLENNTMPNNLIMLNGLTFVMSGSVVVYTFSLLRFIQF
jgi:hypothetical protein